MKTALLGFALCTLFSSCQAQKTDSRKPEDPSKKAAKTMVLVELFTSEGCSSCPPADKALAYLAKQPLEDVEIVPLALHVDYWDNEAWRDQFSSHEYTQRQEDYARTFKISSTYTPEMVVDGQAEFVGSNLEKGTKAIGEASKAQKGQIVAAVDKNKLSIKAVDLPDHEKATVFLAVTENNIVSNVSGGENGGSRLEHSSVVRRLTPIGTVEGGAAKFDVVANLEFDAAWKAENLNIIVFVQENKGRKIIAIGKAAR
jgi:hypothetical protein